METKNKVDIQTTEQELLPPPSASMRHYSTPEGYLEGLQERILKHVEENSAPTLPARPIGLWTKVRPIIYLAASFIGISLGFDLLQRFAPEASQTTSSETIASLSSESYAEWNSFYESYTDDLLNSESEQELLNTLYDSL